MLLFLEEHSTISSQNYQYFIDLFHLYKRCINYLLLNDCNEDGDFKLGLLSPSLCTRKWNRNLSDLLVFLQKQARKLRFPLTFQLKDGKI